MTTDIAPRLARNSSYYAIKSFVALAAMLLVTPYVIKTVGTAQYGVWALAGVMTSYAQLSDFGITESLVKFAAEYHASRDVASLNRLINTSLVIMLMLAVVVGGTIILVLPFIINNVLHIPPMLQSESLIVFRLSVIIFLFNMIMGICSALIIGSQNVGYICSINVASTVVSVVSALLFLRLGWGLRGLVATNAVVAVFTGAMNFYVVSRMFPDLQFGFIKWVDKAMVKQIISFSWKVQTASLSQLLIFQIDRILLSRYLGLEAVAFYEVGSNIAYYAKTFLGVLFTPIIPAVSALQAQNENAMITGLYNRSFKFMVMLAVPLSLLVIALANPFIRMWMGPGFALAALTLQLLMPAYLVSALTNPGSFILNGINRPDVAMRSALFAGLVNLLLCFVLVKTVGYFGLIIGITLSLVGSAAYFATMLHKVLPEIEWRMYKGAFFWPLVFSVPLAFSFYKLDHYFDLGSITALMTFSLLYFMLMVMLLYKSNYLDEFERRVFDELFKFKRRVR